MSHAFRIAAGRGFMLASLLASSAHAATFTVTTNADSGAGSLPQAIADANANADADTIQIAPNIGLIVLASPLTVTNPVTIEGARYGVATISGNNSTRIFVTMSATVTLRNLKLVDGRAFGGAGGTPGGGGGLGAGGCLFVNAGNVTLDQVGFQGCSATGGNGAPIGSPTTNIGGGSGGAMQVNGFNTAGTGGAPSALGSPTGQSGAGGAGSGNGIANPGAIGGFGGGGGAGGSVSGLAGTNGPGGAGGFGGGGGAPGTTAVGPGFGAAVGGTFGGAASSFAGGGGAALGPAVFVNGGIITYTGSGQVQSVATPGTGGGGGASNNGGAATHHFNSTANGSLFSGSLPVAATTGVALNITATNATLNGTVNDGGSSTSVSFQFGTTTAYGSSASAGTVGPALPAGTDHQANANISGLTCGTTYHFTVRGQNAVGASTGGDATFQTTACLAQTITFGTAPAVYIGGTGTVTATATSGLAVTYTTMTSSTCSVDAASGLVTGIAQGTCTIKATHAGNATYAAGEGTQSFTIEAPPRLINISTRMQVLTGNDVMIGGFVIGGSGNKTVVVRARGPSLIPFGITNALANPTLQLVQSSDQSVVAVNDDWQSATNAADVTASGFAPSNGLESAILASLPPGAYTAIVSGVGNATGVGIVEVFEATGPEIPLLNISTRGQVLTGNDVMIGGFVIQGPGPQTVVVRARGPSLIPFGIPNALANPQLQLVRSSDQSIVDSNDDWQSHANAANVTASGFAPSNAQEAAIHITLQPGAYTAIVSGVGGGTGVGIVEVFRAN